MSRIHLIRRALLMGGPGGIDGYVKLMLHMDGADTSTTFTDVIGHTFTANGNAQIDTAQSVFGGASALFAADTDWIDTPDHADYTLGSGDFTVDYRVRFSSVAGNARVFGQADATAAAATSSCGAIMLSGSGPDIAGILWSPTVQYLSYAGATLLVDTWYHVAHIRSGNNFWTAVNGTLGTPADVTGVTATDSGSKFAIGRLGEYTLGTMRGWIDEFRFSVGIARWTANFTPPSSAYS